MTDLLLNSLKDAQEENGYLSEKVLKELSTKLNIPIARVYSAATFYMQLHTTPSGKHHIEICGSPSCVLNDSRTIEKFLEDELNIKIGETTEDNLITLKKTSCIGCCDEAPAMLVDGMPQTKLTKERIIKILEDLRGKNADS